MTVRVPSRATPALDVATSRTGNRTSVKSAPQKQGRKRRVVVTESAKATYVWALADGFSEKRAAIIAGHDPRVFRRHKQADESFAVACADAYEDGTDEYEDALRELALEQRHPTAVIFALKNRRPQVWKDRHELTHAIPTVDVQRLLARLAEFVPVDQRDVFMAELDVLAGDTK